MTEVAEKRKAPASSGVRHYAPATDLQVRADEAGGGDGPVKFSGYAIRWDDPTEIWDWLGSFTELFKRGAFKKTVAERGPEGNGQIKFQRGHSSAYGAEFIAANAARFLSLEEDDVGLRFDAETIGTGTGRDLAAELRAGTIDTLSIGFDAVREEWDHDEETRTIFEARLFEISAVNWPAYPNATVDSVRAFDRMGAFVDALREEVRAGKVLSAANMERVVEARDLLDTVIESASKEDGPGEDPPAETDALDIELAIRERELALERK